MTVAGGLSRAELSDLNAFVRDDGVYFRCDAIGCNETHPIDHEYIGEVGFDFGHWLGWLYLDLNRPDLFPRVLRFCSTWCVRYWLDRETYNKKGRPISGIDAAIRAPNDEVAVRRALAKVRGEAG